MRTGNQTESKRIGPGLRRPRLAAAFLLLVLGMNLLLGCGGTSTPAAIASVAPIAATSTPTPSPAPTLTDLPTVPAVQVTASAVPTSVGTRKATSSATLSPTKTATPTSTPMPSPTSAVPPTAMWTADPAASGSIPLTGQPITPTLTPTLTPTPQLSPTPLPTAVGSGEWLNVLLIGLDSTANLQTQNTDVIIVASINKDSQQVSMLSIPRDLWVYIPTYGWSRINVAHKKGYSRKHPEDGPALLMRTIEMNLGIPIDHWARIDFEGFTRVVDALGGVDMTVACPVNLEYRPNDASGGEVLQPGVYHMDGATALRYVRTRRGGSDFDRARRQQQFLKAMWDQRKELDIPAIIELYTALKDSVTTDLGLADILSLAPLALRLKPQRIRSRFIGSNQTIDWTTADGWQVLLPRYDRIQQVVASLYAPPSTSGDQVANETARVQVRNGTANPYLAQVAADELRWQGLSVLDIGPADRSDYAKTQILVFREKPETLALLTQLLKVKPENVIRQPDAGQPADLQVILGSDYNPCR